MEVYEKAVEHELCGLFVYLCVSQLMIVTAEAKNLFITSSYNLQLICHST